MYKKKYKKGVKVKNIKQLSAYNDYLYFGDHLQHAGWWQSFQFRFLKNLVEKGNVYFADKTEK